MRTHDDYALNGNWHYCRVCDTRWSDADGWCDCPESQEPSEEEEDQDERELREWHEERRKAAR